VARWGVPPGRIGLWAQSFGSAAVLATAEAPAVRALVTDSAFADPRHVIDKEIHDRTGAPPVFTPGVTAAARLLYGFDLAAIAPERAVWRIAPRPILFVHGDADARIPVAEAYRLKAASRDPADELRIVPGAGHVLAYAEHPEANAARVLAFVRRHLA
jgi:fermentation-respiration switch protein FrsA (DUF1100 family)